MHSFDQESRHICTPIRPDNITYQHNRLLLSCSQLHRGPLPSPNKNHSWELWRGWGRRSLDSWISRSLELWSSPFSYSHFCKKKVGLGASDSSLNSLWHELNVEKEGSRCLESLSWVVFLANAAHVLIFTVMAVSSGIISIAWIRSHRWAITCGGLAVSITSSQRCPRIEFSLSSNQILVLQRCVDPSPQSRVVNTLVYSGFVKKKVE